MAPSKEFTRALRIHLRYVKYYWIMGIWGLALIGILLVASFAMIMNNEEVTTPILLLFAVLWLLSPLLSVLPSLPAHWQVTKLYYTNEQKWRAFIVSYGAFTFGVGGCVIAIVSLLLITASETFMALFVGIAFYELLDELDAHDLNKATAQSVAGFVINSAVFTLFSQVFWINAVSVSLAAGLVLIKYILQRKGLTQIKMSEESSCTLNVCDKKDND